MYSNHNRIQTMSSKLVYADVSCKSPNAYSWFYLIGWSSAQWKQLPMYSNSEPQLRHSLATISQALEFSSFFTLSSWFSAAFLSPSNTTLLPSITQYLQQREIERNVGRGNWSTIAIIVPESAEGNWMGCAGYFVELICISSWARGFSRSLKVLVWIRIYLIPHARLGISQTTIPNGPFPCLFPYCFKLN